MAVQDRLTSMGILLPPAPKPVGSYVAAVQACGFVYTSGQLPMRDGQMVNPGIVGVGVTIEQAQDAAKVAVLNALAILAAELGSLDQVKRLVRLTCYVASEPGFTQQPKVANAASDLVAAILGDCGLHTRCAVGVAVLPLNACVEIDLIAAI